MNAGQCASVSTAKVQVMNVADLFPEENSQVKGYRGKECTERQMYSAPFKEDQRLVAQYIADHFDR